MLSHEEARAFYDRLGAGQDWSSRWFEDPATRDLVAHSDLETAGSVVEFGCGTGRFAENLLATRLPPEARYLALDQSQTMTELATARLARFGPRARVVQTDGSPKVGAPDASFARFFSNYVLDLLSPTDIRAVLGEAHRLLRPRGLLCLTSLSRGIGPVSRLFERGWRALHARHPAWVGGCRPVDLLPFLDESRWEIRHAKRLSPLGVPSQVVVARRRPSEPA